MLYAFGVCKSQLISIYFYSLIIITHRLGFDSIQ